MPADLEIGKVKPIEGGGIDVGGHNSAVAPDLLGKPYGHRSAAGAHFETAPAWLDAGTPLAGDRIEDVFEEA